MPMQSQSDLYKLLLKIEKAAEKGSKEKVLALREKYGSMYAKIMPMPYGKGSSSDLYDVALNKIINSIDDMIAPTPEEKKAELAEAKRIISMIPKPKY